MSHIQVDNVSVQFPIFKEKTDASFLQKMIGIGVDKSYFFALKDINFNLHKGDRLALLGKNGSGKSTLLKVLAGVLPPSNGQVNVTGKIFPALSPTPGVIRGATCSQNIILQGLAYGLHGQELEEYVKQVSEFSELGDFLNSKYNALSAGMRSRFAVSTMNQAKPQILFMDEWVGSSDAKVLEKNKGLLSSIVEGSDIFVLASHRKELVRDHCNKALVLKKGKVLHYGDIDEGLELSNQ